MKGILFFADRLPPLVGGMEIHAGNFIHYFKSHKYFPLLAVITKNKANQDCILEGNNLLPIGLNELPNLFNQNAAIIFFNSGRWIEDLEFIKSLFPQSLFVYRTGGNEIIKAPLERIKISSHADRQKYWGDQINKHIDILVTNSSYTEKRLFELGLKTSLFSRCVGGVNVNDLFSFEQNNQRNGSPVFFSAARFVSYKNHDLLLTVFERISKRGLRFLLRLAGEGPLIDFMKRKVQEAGLSEMVEFLGAISNDQVLKEIREADFYVQLSGEYEISVEGGKYVHAEGMGRSILEAISQGVFVITTKTGALPEIISPKRGVLVNAEATEDIVSCIVKLLQSRPEKPCKTTEYSWQEYFLKYEKTWKNHEATFTRY